MANFLNGCVMKNKHEELIGAPYRILTIVKAIGMRSIVNVFFSIYLILVTCFFAGTSMVFAQGAPSLPPPPLSSVASSSHSLPPPPLSSSAPSSLSSPPLPSSSAAAKSPVPLNQFEDWLKSNGYAENSEGPQNAPSSNSPITTSANANAATTTTTIRTNVQTAANPFAINPVGDINIKHHPVRRRYRDSRPLTYEERKAIMLNTAPLPDRPVSEDAAIAFQQLLQQNMPLSPQQVVKLRQQIDVAQRAASIPAIVPPKPVSSTIMVNLAPGTTPPAIRLAQGYVSSLVFVDSTGAPWPIAAFDIGNPRAVSIQWDGKSNILIIQAVMPYSDGDMVIRLVGLPTPITLELVAGQPVVDYRVDLHVAGIGPNTKELPIGTTLPNSANELLLGVLDGVGPAGSRLLTVRGADAQAWLLGERIFLRTRFTVLSPGWMGTMVSSDGMHAYEMSRTSTVLISRYGEPADLRIEGF